MRNLALDDDDPIDTSNVADTSIVLQDADGNEYTAIVSRRLVKKKEDILAKLIQERSSGKSSLEMRMKVRMEMGMGMGTKVEAKAETKMKAKVDPLSENIRKLIYKMIQEILGKLNIAPEFMKEVSREQNIMDDDPMDIDVTQVDNNVKDLVTVQGTINGKAVSVILDTGSNRDIIPKSLANELGLKCSKKIRHNLRGISGTTESSEITNVTINLDPDCNIKTNVIIVDDYPIQEVILGRVTLRRYNYDLHNLESM
ncbi:hypothetical protein C1645_809643 [Glomus cerebriforme]|uniref:Peptidase A2 domain-containing protein n=1 Tax=Glomus cerebriforme TaxID=658196 RepID=A0A397SCC7_9GLOM|nr:hypothetical protein C1645_809643 [Glomus cerebriforme]